MAIKCSLTKITQYPPIIEKFNVTKLYHTKLARPRK